MANYCTCNTNSCQGSGTVAGDSTSSGCPLAGILGDSIVNGSSNGSGSCFGLCTKDLLILISVILLLLVLLWNN